MPREADGHLCILVYQDDRVTWCPTLYTAYNITVGSQGAFHMHNVIVISYIEVGYRTPEADSRLPRRK